MLKMKCPSCENEIVSPWLSEFRQIKCPACKENVPVKNIIVYSHGFSYDRSQLRSKIYRYKELLSAAYKEHEKLKNSPESSSKSKASSERLVATLEEILAGARTNFRVKMLQEYFVTYKCGPRKGFARLLNLSTDGASIQSTTSDFLPGKEQDILLYLAVPGSANSLLINGKVSWSRLPGGALQNHRIGIRFPKIDFNTKSYLWQFIEEVSTQKARQ